MLRYKTKLDIRPGNGAGLFLQPGACTGHRMLKKCDDTCMSIRFDTVPALARQTDRQNW